MEEKSMHITMKIYAEAELAWLPKKQEGGGEEKYCIDLNGYASRDEVDTLLRVLASYNDSYLDTGAKKDVFLRQMHRGLDRRDLTLPGGIRFEGDGCRIYPGCCCGVEQWVYIFGELKEHQSPWMGHNPDVSFLEKDGVCYIADTGLRRRSFGRVIRGQYGVRGKVGVEDAICDKKIRIIGWPEQEFEALLNRLDGEFEDFLNGPLQERMEQLAGEWARQFVRAFARCFRRHNNIKMYSDSIKLIL